VRSFATFLAVLLLVGCGAQTEKSISLLSKAEWRAQLIKQYGQAAQIGVVGSWNSGEFTKVMGSPESTQTIGNQAFWYYKCSDGTIQLALDAGNLSVGVMQGRINDF
jgi:hypothetical protein